MRQSELNSRVSGLRIIEEGSFLVFGFLSFESADFEEAMGLEAWNAPSDGEEEPALRGRPSEPEDLGLFLVPVPGDGG